MRDTDERLRAVLCRAEALDAEEKRRRGVLLAAASVAACLVLIVLAAFAMPGLTAQLSDAPGAEGAVSASLFADSKALGYLVIGILSFLLGTAVTVLCFRLRDAAGRRDKAA